MEPEMPRLPLADQAWFIDLLTARGFYRSSPTTFSNGKASLRVAGNQFQAYLGTGGKPWTSDLADA